MKYLGKTKDVYVVNAQKGGVTVSGSSLTLNHGPRVYLGKSCDQSMNGDMFWNPNLMGRNVSYDVDLGAVGCACNAALYLVSMPARDNSGNAIPTKCGDYYCDANYVCDVGCPEIDIQEANNHAWATTPHKCDGSGPTYSNCDGGGCGRKFDINQFGPGKNIDTNQKFNLRVSFAGSGTHLDHMLTTISQNGKSLSVRHDDCGGGYLDSVGAAIAKGMTFTISNWGGSSGGMSWLDIPPCGGENCNNGAARFSNLVID